jgi:heme/copper-type cytochrome/quinol oxidase subunit 2
MTESRSLPAALLRISFGPLVWFAHLNALYAANMFDCLDRTGGSAGVTIFATVGALAGIVGFAWRLRASAGHETAANIGMAVSGLSALAVFWTALAFASGGTHCG